MRADDHNVENHPSRRIYFQKSTTLKFFAGIKFREQTSSLYFPKFHCLNNWWYQKHSSFFFVWYYWSFTSFLLKQFSLKILLKTFRYSLPISLHGLVLLIKLSSKSVYSPSQISQMPYSFVVASNLKVA